MRIAFFLPAPLELLTGAQVYNRRMIAEWQAAGHDVTALPLAGRHPLADDAALQAAAEAWAAMPPDAVPVIDNNVLPSFAPLAEALSTRGAVVLDHHPTGLEPGLNEADAAALLAIEARLLPLCRHVVTPSDTIAETIAAQFGVAREVISVLNPGTDDAPRAEGSGGPGVHVLSIGSLIPRCSAARPGPVVRPRLAADDCRQRRARSGLCGGIAGVGAGPQDCRAGHLPW